MFTSANYRARHQREMQACARYAAPLAAAISSAVPDRFVQVISDMCSELVNVRAPIRRTPIGTSPDLQGARWRYAPPDRIVSGLFELCAYLKNQTSHSPVVKAVVSHVVIACLRPFSDGNGRTARVIFNALISGSGQTDSLYIPCQRFCELSRHGYNIRSRLAHIHGEWNDIIVYFCKVIEAYYKTMTRALRPRSTRSCSVRGRINNRTAA
ncbi:Fic family protein [Undibacterium sp.]|uniref:Fic family protein n=1 Tax=Undibacterium sp. TaxID=1914977 RepID=UPI002BD68D95|nr:Fic family protein [Undibacterium sp.]HTD05221.1 Fic family protein [Undibacterium sp.]